MTGWGCWFETNRNHYETLLLCVFVNKILVVEIFRTKVEAIFVLFLFPFVSSNSLDKNDFLHVFEYFAIFTIPLL